MYNSGLIPARFLTLIAHLVICINIIWSIQENTKLCLMEGYNPESQTSQKKQLTIGLSLALGMLVFELLTFLIGITMFNSTSALLSVLFCLFYICSAFFAAYNPTEMISLLSEKEEPQGGWTKLLVLAGVATTIGSSLPVGYNIGVVNSPAEIIKRFCNESIYVRYGHGLSNDQMNLLWPAIVSIFLVGGTIGSLTGSWLADKLGRKGGLIGSAALLFTSGVLFLTTKMANSVEMLLLARLIIGLASGAITCIMPMYLTELAPLHLRGAMGVLCPLGVTFGVLLAQIMSLREVLGTEALWPILFSFYIILVVLCSMAFPFLPESPKYLYVVRKQSKLAIATLEKIRNMGVCDLEDEIHELDVELQDLQKTSDQAFGYCQVLTDRHLLLPLALVCSMQAGQQFSGINAVFYYSKSTFQTAGLSGQNSEYATVGAGVVNFLMAVISIYLMSRFNRRTTFLLSAISSVVCLIVLGIAITYIKTVSWMPYLSILGMLSYVCTYGIGLGPIPYFIGSELFEVGPRPIAMALGSMANWGGNFTVAMIFPILQEKIGPASFFIFAFITFLLYIFLRIYLPESRGRDPSELAQLMKSGFRLRPSASSTDSSIAHPSATQQLKPKQLPQYI